MDALVPFFGVERSWLEGPWERIEARVALVEMRRYVGRNGWVL
jgi:hypothetical protein